MCVCVCTCGNSPERVDRLSNGTMCWLYWTPTLHKNYCILRFEVLRVILLWIQVFWCVKLCHCMNVCKPEFSATLLWEPKMSHIHRSCALCDRCKRDKVDKTMYQVLQQDIRIKTYTTLLGQYVHVVSGHNKLTSWWAPLQRKATNLLG
jgi:hypothetical protein